MPRKEKAAMSKKEDVLLEDNIELMGDQEQKDKCKFCGKTIAGGISQMKHHLSKLTFRAVEPCTKVPTSVRESASDGVQLSEEKKNKRQRVMVNDPCDALMISSSKNTTAQPDIRRESNHLVEPDEKSMEANKAFGRWAFSQNVPLDSFKSPYFLEACKLIVKNGPYHDPQISDLNKKKVLSELYEEAAAYVESVKQSCRIYGCTLIIDMWEHRKMYYVAVMAGSIKGTILLKSICSPKLPSNERIEELTLGLMLGIGFENVVQILLPHRNWLSEFDARVYKITGVCVRRPCKLTLADVIFGIHTTEIFEDVYVTCRKIFEFLDSKLTDPSLMKMHTNYQVLQHHCVSEYKRQYMVLKIVLKEEEALRHMFASEETIIQDPNDAEVKRIVQGTVFWEQGRKTMRSIEYLSSLLRTIDNYAANLSFIYDAYLRAREATEALMAESGSDSFVLRRAHHMMVEEMDCPIYKMGAHLNPRLFYYRQVELDEGDIEELDCAIGLLVPTGKSQKLVKELRDYRALDKSIFGEMAIKSIRSLHPRVWWERWGDGVPTLQSVAIKILSQPCSFQVTQELRNIIQDMHEEEMNSTPAKWQEQLLLRVHSHLMGTTAAGKKETDLRPILLDERKDHLDDSSMEDSSYAPDDSESASS